MVSASDLGAAHGDVGDAHGRAAHADGHGLAVFSAGPDAVRDLEVAAEEVDARQHLGAVSDQVHALERGGELAVLDQVALGQREDEVAVGDVPENFLAKTPRLTLRSTSSGSLWPPRRMVLVIRGIGE